MGITRIAKMHGLGIFQDFTWPTSLPEFGRYNLVYGWNWSGKTTLSNLLRKIETRVNETEAQVIVTIDGRDTHGEHLAEVALPIRVFNRDFVAENVFTAQGEIAPIFVLGKENIEKQKLADKSKSALEDARADLQKLDDAKEDADKALDSFCISQATMIRDLLRSSGSSAYNNYDKRNFRQKAEWLTRENDPTSYQLEEALKTRLRQQHLASAKPRLPEISYAFPNLEALHSNVSHLLSDTVVSSIIEALKEDVDLASWVRDGLAKHKARDAKTCLFCGQELPVHRIAELEAHFSDEYENFLGRIDAKTEEIETLLNKMGDSLTPPNKAELYDDLSQEYQTALADLQEQVQHAKVALLGLQEAAIAKKDAPFEARALDVTLPCLQTATLGTIKAIIEKHNSACDQFSQRVTSARQKLEHAMVADALSEFRRLADNVCRLTEDVEVKRKDAREKEASIADLERDIVEHREPADELNEDLRAYLGHGELKLAVEETGYRITRHGNGAEGLSEGERTAISLLYFLKSLNDRRFDLRKGVVVLDDPVSSLDSNAIFCAFGFIRERTKAAGQLFVLTHNFTFFRQVRNWFHRAKGQNKKKVTDRPARFYMLDCTANKQGRLSTMRSLDPLLEQHESEYHYLFRCVYEKATAPPSENLEAYYFMPNVARRLLEAFLAFRMPEAAGNIWQQLQGMEFDQARKVRVWRFLHTYSHHEEIGEQAEDLSILSETRAILNDILKLMQTEDPKHFSGMVSVIRAHDEEADEAEQMGAG